VKTGNARGLKFGRTATSLSSGYSWFSSLKVDSEHPLERFAQR
jgi:hypothetical protein